MGALCTACKAQLADKRRCFYIHAGVLVGRCMKRECGVVLLCGEASIETRKLYVYYVNFLRSLSESPVFRGLDIFFPWREKEAAQSRGKSKENGETGPPFIGETGR